MTGFIVSVFPFRNRVSSKEAFEELELGEGKPSRPVLRGPGGRKAAWLLGNYVSILWLFILKSVLTWPIRCLPENVQQRYLWYNVVALIRNQCRPRYVQRDYNDKVRRPKTDG